MQKENHKDTKSTKIFLKFFVLFLSLWFLPHLAFAEDLMELGKPSFRVYKEEDGLPSNKIYEMAFDKKGYVWVGTSEGAAYYDGHKWTTVRMPAGALSNDIRTILFSDDGSVWFGTLIGGLHCLKDGKWTLHDIKSGALMGNNVRDLLESKGEDGRRTLWVATSKSGLSRYEDGKWTSFNPKNSGLPDNLLLTLLESKGADGKRSLWIGTFGGGLVRYEGDKWTTFNTKNSGLPDDTVTSLVESVGADGRRALWVATNGGGLARYGDGQWTTFNTKNSGLPNDIVGSLLESVGADGRHTLWVGTNSGLARYEEGKWTTFNTRNSGLPDDIVASLVESKGADGRRTLWVGTGSGLARYEEGQWIYFDTRNSGLPGNSVFSFLESKGTDGRPILWVGTESTGLARYEEGQWTTFNSKNSGFPSDAVGSLIESKGADGQPVLWVEAEGGLAKYEKGQWTTFTTKNSGLPNNIILRLKKSIGADGRLTLWMGTMGGGLARYEEGQWTVFNTKNSGLPSDFIYTLLESVGADGRRTLWVGTVNGGLVRYEDGKWTTFDTKNSSLPHVEIRSLLESKGEDGRRRLWVGTRGGLTCFDPDSVNGKWVTFNDSTVPALPNNIINDILKDSQQRIYICTQKGIVRLTPHSPAANDPSDFRAYTFNKEDGLPGNLINVGATMLDEKGRIWVGTSNGVGILDPFKFIDDQTAKPLLIERILVNGRQYIKGRTGTQTADDKEPYFALYGDSLDKETLAYNENNIVFEYALLSYFKEKQTLYQTQLIGFNEKPNEWTTEARQTFTNLGEGNYRFKVWGRDYAGNITGPVEMAFRIKPAPWRTWWAYLFYSALIAGIVYSFLQYRLRALEQRNQLLEAKIQERTATIAQQNEELINSEKRAMEASRAKSTFLANMSHELRTPLNAILGFVQLMARTPARERSDKEKLSIIMRSGEHLLGLINDVLSISKIEAGQITLRNQSFNLQGLLENLEEMFRLRAQTQNLQFEVSYDPKLPQFVMGDEGRLRQVLINLLGNAFKFTEKGTVRLRVSYQDYRAFFEVQDTGQGMEREELERIFDPFVQTESGLRAKEGTGLGLAISKNLIQLMDGDISVQSQKGVGSTFSFDVKLKAAPLAEEIVRERNVISVVPGQEDYRVLVVDDVEESRTFLSELLSTAGFRVRQAANGLEAVEIWQEWHPHLIWMDMKMPLMDGNTATKLIREKEQENQESNGKRRTVIIALTASSFENDRSVIMAEGCDDFVLKPYKVNLVFEKLAQFLDIKFIFEEESQISSEAGRLTSLNLSFLPSELLAELNRSVINGNVEEAKKVAEKIKLFDSRIAQDLEIMIKNYKFDEILVLIEKNHKDTKNTKNSL